MSRYFKYFKVPFIITAVIMVICIAIKLAMGGPEEAVGRTNTESLIDHNVFDYANCLTDEQISELENYINDVEDVVQCDIAIVILNETLEGYYNNEPKYWVKEFADQFADANKMGYDKPLGDNIVFVDNQFREPATDKVYSWISTYGAAYDRLSQSSCEAIMDDALADLTDYSQSSDYYNAYRRVVTLIPRYISSGSSAADLAGSIRPIYILGASLLIALIYVLVNWKSKLGDRTTTSTTYVQGGKPNITRSQDIFLRKTVTKHKRESSSGGSGGGGGHGGGGHSR